MTLNVRIPDGVELEDYIFGHLKCGENRLLIFCNAGSNAMKYARKLGVQVRRYKDFELTEEDSQDEWTKIRKVYLNT
jgi:hypothetical protein